jgi:hypothetical protein
MAVFFFVRAAIRPRSSLLLLLLAPPLAACAGGDSALVSEAPLLPSDSTPPVTPPLDPEVPPVDSAAPAPAPAPPPAPGAYVGIPFGPFGLPAKLYGEEFNATFRALPPKILLSELEAARQAGARVVVRLVGGHSRYKRKGTFDLDLWKARVDRFRDIDFSSYIDDGTIVGHFILDEPNDRSNWGGKVISRATVDEMARYSKGLWPSMPTIVRGWPAYLKGYDYQYLDAAWAQYSDRFGPISSFMSDNVRDAKAAGLALVVGLNLLDGGTKASGIKGFSKGKHSMSPSQVKTWGNALLSDSYVCAFLSWKYTDAYFSRAGIKSALADLSEKAKGMPNKGCRRR